MKENVFDVLIYLFENYMDEETEVSPDPDSIRSELLEIGFPHKEINRAFDWLESLSEQKPIQTSSPPAFRIYSAHECIKLDTECRGLLMFLEQTTILNPACRELVVDRVMALSEGSISLENLKWIVMMVLFSQPSEEIAFARMENLVYESMPSFLH